MLPIFSYTMVSASPPPKHTIHRMKCKLIVIYRTFCFLYFEALCISYLLYYLKALECYNTLYIMNKLFQNIIIIFCCVLSLWLASFRFDDDLFQMECYSYRLYQQHLVLNRQTFSSQQNLGNTEICRDMQEHTWTLRGM